MIRPIPTSLHEIIARRARAAGVEKIQDGMAERVNSRKPDIRPERPPGAGPALFPLNHRDAIRARDPVARLGGLALEFAGSMVAAPMALFLLARDGQPCSLAEIKVDSILTPDPAALERDCVASIEADEPTAELPGGAGQSLVMDRAALDRDLGFSESDFANRLMPAWGLESIISLILRPVDPGATCVISLLRMSGQSEFTEREKGFLRHWAPLISQSLASVIDAERDRRLSTGSPSQRSTDSAGLVLTRREMEIARMVASGKRNEEIAETLHITVGTVKCHVRSIYSKLGIHSRVHLSLLLADG
ncbi:MAG: LuxR C-terminal-related transcriptional regulator [Solirubrobacterales bacterium]|nr:LuxR C-terminal-related transcriptional regulator [Solirubrobacterales bacterium]